CAVLLLFIYPPPPLPTRFPYTTLFRSTVVDKNGELRVGTFAVPHTDARRGVDRDRVAVVSTGAHIPQLAILDHLNIDAGTAAAPLDCQVRDSDVRDPPIDGYWVRGGDATTHTIIQCKR